MNLLAIDPGYAASGRGCACALFCGEDLTQVFWHRSIEAPLDCSLDQVVWECPQVDARTRHSVPATVQLAAEGGMVAGMFAGASSLSCSVTRVAPSEWKGSVPKPVHHGRIWKQLRPFERKLLGGSLTGVVIAEAIDRGALDRWAKPGVRYYPRSFDAHNLLDAVGLGLWRLGR